MPRKPRIEFPGSFYHIIARGNKKGGQRPFLIVLQAKAKALQGKSKPH